MKNSNDKENIFRLLEDFFLIITGTTMLMIVTYDVINRYFFANAFPWTHEVIRCLYIWVCFIAISYTERRDNNGVISITYFEDRFTGFKRKIVLVIQNIITIIFYLILISASIDIIRMSYIRNASTPTLNIPYWLIYSGFLVGIIFSVIRKLMKSFTLLRSNI